MFSPSAANQKRISELERQVEALRGQTGGEKTFKLGSGEFPVSSAGAFANTPRGRQALASLGGSSSAGRVSGSSNSPSGQWSFEQKSGSGKPIPGYSGGGYSGGFSFTPGEKADSINARLTKAQYQDYVDRFRQREIDFVERLNNGDYGQAIDRSGDLARSAYDASLAVADRSFARYGAQVTPLQKRMLDSLREHGSALADVGAENRSRDVLHDTRQHALSNLANIGRGVRSLASSGLSQAAGLQSSRDATNRQLAAQRSAGRIQNTVTGGIGGYALGAQIGSVGGPAGAIAGAALGFLLS